MTQVAQEIPKIGLVMDAVKVVRWLKAVGDTVIAGEPLLEVESEKSIVEIEAAATGRLTEILVQVDDEVTVGVQVAWIESAETQPAASPAARAPAATAAPPTAAPPTAAPPTAASSVAAPSAPPATSPVDAAARAAERIRSSPVARKLAAERGIDLRAVTGTGPGGRIQQGDVQRAAAASAGAAVAPPGQPLSPMRRALARSMTLSNATVPQFNVSRSVDWTVLQGLRRELNGSLPAGTPTLSVTDFLLAALARALLELPALNATFHGDADSPDARIVAASGAHVGLVVAVDNGLLVPVIHDLEVQGLADIARRREACVERAHGGRLKREEMEGATISLSNLGARGPDRFTALINPPQSAILAVGRQRQCVVARDGAVVVLPQSELTLTVDHRVADGRLAAQFLARVIALLEGRDWRV